MSESTREKIIAKGAEIIHKKGFNNTGIQEILAACQVPKGSFYHYFPSKEDFGIAVVEHHAATVGVRARSLLLDKSIPPLERLELFFRRGEERYAGLDYEQGCPIGNLTLELADLFPALREKLAATLGGLARVMAQVLTEAEERGELPPGLDPTETAEFIVEAWEGALLRMKVVKNGEPLVRCRHMIMERLLAR